MSPIKGRRPPSGKGGNPGAGRPSNPVFERRRGLLVFGGAFVVLFLVIAIAEGIGDPSVPSGDVAIVEHVPGDGGKLSEADFEHALELAAAQAGEKSAPKPSDEKYDELKEAALNSLLDQAWIEGLAAEKGISVSDEEVAEELKKLKKENFETKAAYQEFLKESRYTPEDVDDRVRLQILSTQIQEEVTEGAPKPSGSEVAAYYEEAKAAQFTQKASREVRLVLNKDRKKAEAAKGLLEKDHSTKSWEKVAKKYSEDASTKNSGGHRPTPFIAAEGSPEDPLNAAVFEASEQRVEGPVKSTLGYYVFEVESSTPEEVQALKDVESQIESQLAQQAQQESFSTFVANYKSTWRSRTFCAPGYTIERCANSESSGHPAEAPPACYEADPVGGLPEACPAPVFQLAPALPGSVNLLEPRGKPLAQRPQPDRSNEEEEAAEAAEAGGAAGAPPLTP